jgi:hypothetical protein
LTTAHAFKSTSAIERDTAGAQLANMELLSAELRQRAAQLDKTLRTVEKLAAEARVESALLAAEQNRGLECQAPLAAAIEGAYARRASAKRFKEQGDDLTDPGRALQYYQEAERQDREFPGLQQQIAKARSRQSAARREQAAHVGKIFAWTVLAAAGAVGTYYGYQAYQRQQQRQLQVNRVR